MPFNAWKQNCFVSNETTGALVLQGVIILALLNEFVHEHRGNNTYVIQEKTALYGNTKKEPDTETEKCMTSGGFVIAVRNNAFIDSRAYIPSNFFKGLRQEEWKWHQIGCITLPDKSNANPIKPRTSLPDIQSHEI